jgi:hypothetical protein
MKLEDKLLNSKKLLNTNIDIKIARAIKIERYWDLFERSRLFDSWGIFISNNNETVTVETTTYLGGVRKVFVYTYRKQYGPKRRDIKRFVLTASIEIIKSMLY